MRPKQKPVVNAQRVLWMKNTAQNVFVAMVDVQLILSIRLKLRFLFSIKSKTTAVQIKT